MGGSWACLLLFATNVFTVISDDAGNLLSAFLGTLQTHEFRKS